MSLGLLQTPKEPNDDGSTSHDTERAGGISAQDRGKEMERSVTTSSEDTSATTNQRNVQKTTIELDGRDTIYSVAFLTDGKHILSGGEEGKIRQWRLEDGKEVGVPMDMGGCVYSIAVSKDGKWIVGGSHEGRVLVWSVESHEQAGEMKGHEREVYAVDISPNGTKIASGSDDKTACIWNWATSERPRMTLQHDCDVAAVKFSPSGRLLATATWKNASVRVYNSEDGRLMAEFSVDVGSNQCLAWNDDTHLYAITWDGKVYYLNELNASTRRTLSRWPIRADDAGKWGCIALPSNRTFIATSAHSSISLWDTTTHAKIGSNIDYRVSANIRTMSISENYDIAIAHGKTVTVRNLGDILSPRYYVHDQNMDPGESITSLHTQADKETTDFKGEIKDQLAIFQGRHEVQSRELASVQKEVEALKLSIKEKDRQIDTLTAEVNHWKRSASAKAEELTAAHKELEERRRDSEELVAVREELQFSQSQTIQARKWYDEQFRHLKSVVEQNQRTPFIVQNFIAQADARTEMNIMETLQQLNETIHWSSMYITDRVIYKFQPRATNPTEEQAPIVKKVAECIGQSLVNRLRSNSRTEVVAYLPIAFRAYLIYHLCGVISSWSIDSGLDRITHELYDVVQKLESQTISARWRSLTYASLSSTCSSNPDMFIAPTMDGLCDIIVTAGCAPSISAAKEMIASKFRRRIFFILTTTGQLTKSIMDALSADYRVETIRPLKPLDEEIMTIDSTGPGKKSRSQFVLCSTHLGLSKQVITQSGVGPNKKNTLTVTNIVKAKVIMG